MQENGVAISRQTIAKQFVELGNYVYLKFALPTFLEALRKANPGIPDSDKSLEEFIVGQMWQTMRGDLNYKFYREIKSPYPGPDELIKALQERWRTFNGFPQNTFRSHLGYAYYTMLAASSKSPEKAYKNLTEHLTLDPL